MVFIFHELYHITHYNENFRRNNIKCASVFYVYTLFFFVFFFGGTRKQFYIFVRMFFISVCSIIKKKSEQNKTPKKNTVEEYNLKKIRINIVIFHCFIIILVTSSKRFIVVEMTFNLQNITKTKTNATRFAYDTHVMHVYLNNILYFSLLLFFPSDE